MEEIDARKTKRPLVKSYMLERVGSQNGKGITSVLGSLNIHMPSPLYAISQLRFPSPVGRGGHDFYCPASQ
jgi:hypothetical protein